MEASENNKEVQVLERNDFFFFKAYCPMEERCIFRLVLIFPK